VRKEKGPTLLLLSHRHQSYGCPCFARGALEPLFHDLRELEELVEKGLLCPITDVIAPEWITPEEGVDVPNLPAGYVLSFVAFHERGLGISASRFLRALPS
jgi:hypothetical protein